MDYSDFQHLRFERRANGVLLITIDRPDALNAANDVLHREFAEIWPVVGADAETRVAVITGAGRAFSVGGDLELLERNLTDIERIVRVGAEAVQIVENMLALEKPIVSAVNGPAAGAGLAVALVADISIAAEDAVLTDAHTRLGVASGDHAVMLWPLLCGMAKAKLYLLTADRLDGREAERIGLVSRCAPLDRVLPEALELADRLALLSQPALRATKRALNHWYWLAAPQFELSVAQEMLNFLQADAREGVRALIEKRRPSFPSAPAVPAP